jgi:putative PIN family toxin of toxin-antitoxin system
LVSLAILAEYREVLHRLAGVPGSEVASKWDLILAEVSEFVEPLSLGGICRDSADEKYLEAAVGGHAEALVSGDKDLLVLKEVRGVPILSPRAFMSR